MSQVRVDVGLKAVKDPNPRDGSNFIYLAVLSVGRVPSWLGTCWILRLTGLLAYLVCCFGSLHIHCRFACLGAKLLKVLYLQSVWV